MPKPKLAVAALGGTVSMQARQDQAGVMPSLSGEALLDSVPGLSQLADVYVETLCLVPSASLTFEDLLRVLEWAQAQVNEGASGVIVTQGTDSLEETAFFLDLLWKNEAPLVVTGAMRPATQAGADGPANLMAAANVAISYNSRRRGVLVVMNDEIHDPRRVRKADSLATHAFASPITGPLGLLIEGRAVYTTSCCERLTLPVPYLQNHQVALLEAVFSDAPLLLDQVLTLDYSGLIVAGFGAGHVSASWADSIGKLTRVMPVIIASRTGSGSTARTTYGFEGGELDLISRGALMSGMLCPRKARILLWLLIGCGRQDDLNDWLEHALWD